MTSPILPPAALSLAAPPRDETGRRETAGARAEFRRARRSARARLRRSARRASPTRPRDLGGLPGLYWRRGSLRAIPLDSIVGTVDPTADFDAGFRPATDRVAARWQQVALAHQEGRDLPPIEVIKCPDGYYVLDGRHRVSVARALGLGAIEAWASPAGGRRADPCVRAA
jgi:hypothetical protein